MFFAGALYSVKALTDAVLSPVPHGRLISLFETHPRLAAKLAWSFACEAAMYAEHLTSVGRRSAIERVAHFLLELQARFEVIGLTDGNSYPMPLTQELISDALGLSVPHVNRTLRQLREDGLLAIEGHRVVLSDRDALCALADFERGYFDNFRAPEFSLNENTAGASAIAADQPQLAAENDRDPLDWRSEPVGLGPRSDRAT